MMRILMFGWEYPPNITGGLGTACYWLTDALVKSGIEINFLVPQSVDSPCMNPSHSEIAKPIKIGDGNLTDSLNQLLLPLSIPSNLSPYPSESILYSNSNLNEEQKTRDSQLQKELEHFANRSLDATNSIDYDLIHAHDWPTYGAAMLAQKISGKPLIVHVHSTEVDRGGNHMNQLIFELEKEGYTMADRIITVSQYTKDILLNRYHIDPEKIEVIYHGVPPGFDHQNGASNLPEFREKVVTFCGRITWQKGPSYFVNAAFKLAEKSEQFRFIMAGEGDLREQMIELTADLGLSKRFHFPGFLTREEVKNLWQISDVLVMPSVSEPFGLTALEAMTTGIPVIISKQSGVAELFPHILKVDYWETNALAELIYQLINNPQMISKQQEQNKKQLAKLSWSASAGQIITLYNSLNPSL